MNKSETAFIDFVRKNTVEMFFLAITILAFLLRITLFKNETYDYTGFISPWIDELSSYKGLSGLGQNIGEYNIPYMFFLLITSFLPFNNLYEVKMFSVIFDYVGAFTAVMIVSSITKTPIFTKFNMLVYSIFLFSPVVFLDSAYWAQCDSIYVSMLLVCVYFLIKEKFSLAMIFFGIAFSFKLQAIIFFPVLIILYFASGKLSIKHFLLIPATYLVSILPAIIAGRGIKDTLMIYIKQTNIYPILTMNCPNIYNLIRGDYETFKNAGIILTVSLLGIAALLYIETRKKTVKEDLILLALWVSQSCIFLLPAMHERYPFITCIFSILWAAVYKKDWYISVIINTVCLLSFLPYLFQVTVINLDYLAIVNFAVLLFLSFRLFVSSPYRQELESE